MNFRTVNFGAVTVNTGTITPKTLRNVLPNSTGCQLQIHVGNNQSTSVTVTGPQEQIVAQTIQTGVHNFQSNLHILAEALNIN
jgi:hypothetical protein